MSESFNCDGKGCDDIRCDDCDDFLQYCKYLEKHNLPMYMDIVVSDGRTFRLMPGDSISFCGGGGGGSGVGITNIPFEKLAPKQFVKTGKYKKYDKEK